MDEEKKEGEEYKEPVGEDKKPVEEATKEPIKEPFEPKQTLTDKLRKNPFIVSTIICGVLAVFLLIAVTSGGITGNVVSGEVAGENVLDFASSQLTDMEILGIEKEDGFYKIEYTSEETGASVLYATLDGEYLVSLIPLTGVEKETEEFIDWNIFENEISFDIKSKILSFSTETSQEYDVSMRINEFVNYELIPKTLIVFYSLGCGWCSEYHPVLVEVMEKYPEINIYALELSDNRDIAEKYGVTGTPANIINGKYFVSGYKPLEDLSKILDELN